MRRDLRQAPRQFLASWFGGYATRNGARPPMVAGCLVLAAGLVLLALAPDRPNYLLHILPGVLLQGLGLSMLVAPLTGTVLAAAPASRSGSRGGATGVGSSEGSSPTEPVPRYGRLR